MFSWQFFFFIFELKKLNPKVRKGSLKILADQNYLTISGAAGLHSYKIALKVVMTYLIAISCTVK